MLAQVEELGLSDQIHFVDPVPSPAEDPDRFSVDLVWMISLSGHIGFAGIESMAAGMPTLLLEVDSGASASPPDPELTSLICQTPQELVDLTLKVQSEPHLVREKQRQLRIIGSHYIQWLSRHRAVFTDSSIYRIELFKYRETAYAGCAPVGDLPWSLYKCPQEAFFHFKSLTDLVRRGILYDPDLTQATALAYRSFLRQLRCRNHWRTRVADAMARLL